MAVKAMEAGIPSYIIHIVVHLKGASVKAVLKLPAQGSTQLKLHGENHWKIHLQSLETEKG